MSKLFKIAKTSPPPPPPKKNCTNCSEPNCTGCDKKKECGDCSKSDCTGCDKKKVKPPSDKDALIEELLGTLMDVERPQVLKYLEGLKHGSP